MRQGATHQEAVAEVARTRNHDQFKRVTGVLIAQHRVLIG
jgi:hypothetical protein